MHARREDALGRRLTSLVMKGSGVRVPPSASQKPRVSASSMGTAVLSRASVGSAVGSIGPHVAAVLRPHESPGTSALGVAHRLSLVLPTVSLGMESGGGVPNMQPLTARSGVGSQAIERECGGHCEQELVREIHRRVAWRPPPRPVVDAESGVADGVTRPENGKDLRAGCKPSALQTRGQQSVSGAPCGADAKVGDVVDRAATTGDREEG